MKLLLLIIVLLAAIMVATMWQGRGYASFMKTAEKTSGTITHKEVRTFRPNQQTGKENWVTYSYALDGHTYSGEEKVEYPDLWQDMQEGQAADIYYNREDPAQSHLAIVLDKRLRVIKTLIGQP